MFEELQEFRVAHFLLALAYIATNYIYYGITLYIVNTNLSRYPYGVAICCNVVYLIMTCALWPAFYGCLVDCTYLYEYHVHEWVMFCVGVVIWCYMALLVKAQ